MNHVVKIAVLATAIAGAGIWSRAAAQQAASAQNAAPGWTRVSSTSAPAGRHESATAYVNGQLYLMGGRSLRPLDILDVEKRRWRNGAPAPFEFHHTQAVVVGSRIYIVGGLTGLEPETPLSHVLIYDPASDSWSRGPELPAGRARGAAGLVEHEGVLYLIGGNTQGHRAGGSVAWLDAIDPRTGVWTQLPDAPRVRDHFQAAVLDGKIYAPAGRVPGGGGAVALMDVYDIATKQWSTVDQPIPTTRSGVGVVAINGLVVVIGGEGGRRPAHDAVEAYDPVRGAWIALPSLPIGRHGTQPVVIGDAIHVVSGSASSGWGHEINDHWMLTVNAR
jgi:N-acetylneuraminic acid mutarotase